MSKAKELLEKMEGSKLEATALDAGVSYGYSYHDLTKKSKLITGIRHNKFGEFIPNPNDIISGWPNYNTDKDGVRYYPYISKDKKYGMMTNSTNPQNFSVFPLTKGETKAVSTSRSNNITELKSGNEWFSVENPDEFILQIISYSTVTGVKALKIGDKYFD